MCDDFYPLAEGWKVVVKDFWVLAEGLEKVVNVFLGTRRGVGKGSERFFGYSPRGRASLQTIFVPLL